MLYSTWRSLALFDTKGSGKQRCPHKPGMGGIEHASCHPQSTITALACRHLQFLHHPYWRLPHSAFIPCIPSFSAKNATQSGAIDVSLSKSVATIAQTASSRSQVLVCERRRTGEICSDVFCSSFVYEAPVVRETASCVPIAEIRCRWYPLIHQITVMGGLPWQ
jgi:hypothetical protein